MGVRNVRGRCDRLRHDSGDVPKEADEEGWDEQPERVRSVMPKTVAELAGRLPALCILSGGVSLASRKSTV
jgi:hypothetical protein